MSLRRYFAHDWDGRAFRLFGVGHLGALALIALLDAALIAFGADFTPGARIAFRVALASLMAVNEIGYHLWQRAGGSWNVQTMLPLHLCSVCIWLSIFILLAQGRYPYLYEFLYFIGIGGAMQALLTPEAAQYGLPHFRAVQTFIAHGGIVIAAVYLSAVEGYRPAWASILHVAIATNAYMAVIFVVNRLMGSNYLFIMRKPDTPSILDLMGPWPLYVLAMEAMGVVVSVLLYAPFAVMDALGR